MKKQQKNVDGAVWGGEREGGRMNETEIILIKPFHKGGGLDSATFLVGLKRAKQFEKIGYAVHSVKPKPVYFNRRLF